LLQVTLVSPCAGFACTVQYHHQDHPSRHRCCNTCSGLYWRALVQALHDHHRHKTTQAAAAQLLLLWFTLVSPCVGFA
jgi:hypothetical protein